MTTPLDEAMSAVIGEVAMGLARKHNLVCIDDSIVCWGCGNRLALLPSLHCGSCLGAHYARKHITSPWCLNSRQACDPNAPQQRKDVA
jgi:hypothetical protein